MSKIKTAIKLKFRDRAAFRAWLTDQASTSEGIFIIGQKRGKEPSITYAEALEEALCFGWIDGVVKSIDDDTYIRYFSARNPNSYFSKKNRDTIEHLIQDGRMTADGYRSIEIAKSRNRYQDDDTIDPALEEELYTLLKEQPPAYDQLMSMGKFSRRAYVGFYMSAKQASTRQKRLTRIVERLIAGFPLP